MQAGLLYFKANKIRKRRARLFSTMLSFNLTAVSSILLKASKFLKLSTMYFGFEDKESTKNWSQQMKEI
jgi:hypothetical protein